MSEDTLTWELLGSYEAADHDFARWCRLVNLNPMTEEVVLAYDVIHAAYATLWLAMGDTFHERLWPIANRWRGKRPKLDFEIRDALLATA